MTCRDMARVAEAVSSSNLSFLVAEDMNIGDEDEHNLPTAGALSCGVNPHLQHSTTSKLAGELIAYLLLQRWSRI